MRLKSKIEIKFDHWKKANNQHGRQAFSRFIMLSFLDGLQSSNSDFVFKGGNLLWHYIKTPRETIDLDLATQTLGSHLEIKIEIEKAIQLFNEVDFSILDFKEIYNEEGIGSTFTLGFKTSSGQTNQFSLDIVYTLPTDIFIIKSTISGAPSKSASIENIIADKLSASHKFKSGNTRMKDYDDLWRISRSDLKINSQKLRTILNNRSIPVELESGWIKYLEESWKRHSRLYKDIPKDLEVIFNEINEWTRQILEYR